MDFIIKLIDIEDPTITMAIEFNWVIKNDEFMGILLKLHSFFIHLTRLPCMDHFRVMDF
jgi:hypothetical protein